MKRKIRKKNLYEAEVGEESINEAEDERAKQS